MRWKIRPSAAHLKFLQRKRQIPFRNFKWKGGTGIRAFLVPSAFRSSSKEGAAATDELRKAGTSGHDPRQIDLLAIVAIVLVVIAIGHFLTEHPKKHFTTSFIEPSQSVRW
jgi:hypothetical protein